MNIIRPSFQILDDLDQKSLPVRIEYCGRICYKSEDRIDEASAIPFVQKMAEHGHNSVLEMGATTFRIQGVSKEQEEAFFRCQPRYLQVDALGEGDFLISGTVRGIKEMLFSFPENLIIRSMALNIHQQHPYFFTLPEENQANNGASQTLQIERLSLEQVEQLSQPAMAKHRWLAIKFIANRAVTHELVRHRPCSFLQESQRYCRYSADKFGNEVTFIKPLFFQEDSAEYQQWVMAMEETEKIYLRLLETSTPQAARTVLPNSCKTEIIVYTDLRQWQHILSLRTPKNADPSMREVMIPLQEELHRRYPDLF